MRDKIPFLDNPWVQFILRVLLAALVTALVFVSMYFSSKKELIDAVNSCFVSGSIALAVGVFSLLNRFGSFDFFEYGAIQVLSSLRKGSPRPYIDLIDYKEQKKTKRKLDGMYFIPYLIIGIIWIIVASILLTKLK